MTGNWLAIDTSTSALTLAVLNEENVLGESNIHAVRNHSTLLIPAIKELVKSLNLTMKDIEGIAAGIGPGSYTGVRIGVTAAKTLAWALGVPLAGVSSLEALTYGGLCGLERKLGDEEGNIGSVNVPDERPTGNQWVIPLMDARRNQVFTGLYLYEGIQWRCLAEDSIRLMGDWAESLVSMSGGYRVRPERVIFTGEVEPFADVIDQFSKSIDCSVIKEHAVIRARDVGFLGLSQWTKGERHPVHAFAPNYAQLTEAEKNLSAKV